MVLGQHLDIENEGNLENLTQEKLDDIHNLKTGRLIECSVMLGQIGSDLGSKEKEVLKDFSRNIGLAFQIRDDILDVIQSQEILGKNKNSDIKNNKTTYIDIVGLDNAKEKAKNLTENALNSINNYQIDNKDILIDLAKYLVERRN